MLFRLRKTRH